MVLHASLDDSFLHALPNHQYPSRPARATNTRNKGITTSDKGHIPSGNPRAPTCSNHTYPQKVVRPAWHPPQPSSKRRWLEPDRGRASTAKPFRRKACRSCPSWGCGVLSYHLSSAKFIKPLPAVTKGCLMEVRDAHYPL